MAFGTAFLDNLFGSSVRQNDVLGEKRRDGCEEGCDQKRCDQEDTRRAHTLRLNDCLRTPRAAQPRRHPRSCKPCLHNRSMRKPLFLALSILTLEAADYRTPAGLRPAHRTEEGPGTV